MSRLRILVVSGLSSDSGCMLRARYLTAALCKAGADARLATGMKALPLWLDWPISTLWNLRLMFTACDVVIGCKPLPTITPLLLLEKLAGALTVVDIDDLDFAYRTGILSRFLRAMQKPFPKRFDIVTYHNQMLEPAIREVFGVAPERLVRLRQGVDLSIFTSQAAGEALTCISHQSQRRATPAGVPALRTRASAPRMPSTVFWRPRGAGTPARSVDTPVDVPWCEISELISDGTKKWVVYPAHLNSASDLDAVFEVIRLASRALPEVRLLVVGGGPGERRFRRMAESSGVADITTFTGHVTPEDVAMYLRKSDAGIAYYKDVPANHYRESMKVREMLALGMKVVTTEVGELKQFSGLTYQTPAIPAEAANCLVSVLRTGGDGREVAGPEFIRHEMDWTSVGGAFLKVLEAAVRRPQSRMEAAYERSSGGDPKLPG